MQFTYGNFNNTIQDIYKIRFLQDTMITLFRLPYYQKQVFNAHENGIEILLDSSITVQSMIIVSPQNTNTVYKDLSLSCSSFALEVPILSNEVEYNIDTKQHTI